MLFLGCFHPVEITRFELVTPCLQGRCSPNWAIPPGIIQTAFRLMGLNGLEPSTSRLSGVRSNQLSYKPMLDTSHFCVMSIKQLNPATTDFPGQFPTKYFQAV